MTRSRPPFPREPASIIANWPETQQNYSGEISFCALMAGHMRGGPWGVHVTLSCTSVCIHQTCRCSISKERFAPPLCGAAAGDNGPRFTHALRLKNTMVSEALMQAGSGSWRRLNGQWHAGCQHTEHSEQPKLRVLQPHLITLAGNGWKLPTPRVCL